MLYIFELRPDKLEGWDVGFYDQSFFLLTVHTVQKKLLICVACFCKTVTKPAVLVHFYGLRVQNSFFYGFNKVKY